MAALTSWGGKSPMDSTTKMALGQVGNPKNQMGVSENVVYYPKPSGFADHYPVFKWLFHWGYTLFSDKPK